MKSRASKVFSQGEEGAPDPEVLYNIEEICPNVIYLGEEQNKEKGY